MAGIITSAYIPSFSTFWALLLLFGAALAIIEYKFIPSDSHPLRSRKLFALPFGFLLAAFAIGGWRYQAQVPKFTAEDLALYQPAKEVTITGTIITYPELSTTSSTAILRAEEININGEPVKVAGKLELRLPAGFHLSYGDQLRLTGDLRSVLAEGAPAHSSYLARRGIYSRMAFPQMVTIRRSGGSRFMSFIYSTRSLAYQFLQKEIPFQEASLLSGILLGIDWTIPRYLEDAYRATGTVHIIAISGFNISLIAWLVIRFFRRLFRPAQASFWALIAIVFYTIMVGAEPAVVRAAVMGSLAIPAYYFGRRVIGIHSLVFTASLMLLFNPTLLWDIGFQLSFLATLGLMTLVDPALAIIQKWISQRFSEEKAVQFQPILVLLISTLAAQFAVSPVLLSLDSAIHLYSLPSNLLILPMQPLLMALGGLSVLLGLVLPPLGVMLIKFTWPFAAFCNQTALRAGILPGAEIIAPPASPYLSLAIVVMLLISASIAQFRRLSQSEADRDM